MFKYTLDNKRYHTLNYSLKKRFNSKVFKVPLDGGLTCPNKASGGCIYCKDESMSSFVDKNNDILTQFFISKNVMLNKWPNSKCIAYFQAGTNTFSDIDTLRELYYSVIDLDDVVGISIATRPDCIDDDCYKLLSEINKKTFLTVELGLQSSKDDTLNIINRGHSVSDFTKCVNRLKEEGIYTTGHIINSLPYESKEDMINTAKYLNKLNIDAVKIHMLFISKGTKLHELYTTNGFDLLRKEEYINIVCDQLEVLSEDIVIERITGDPVVDDLVEPFWLTKKFCVLNDIDKEMIRRNSYQGIKKENY